VSLLGRLEDLSLTDIVQIVFLSRRTGTLEIIDEDGRHTVVFRNGLVVNASAPKHPDLVEWLSKRRMIPSDSVPTVRKMEDSGIPCGTAVLELNLATRDDLAEAIRERITDVVAPLLDSREGHFNFVLSEAMNPVDVEYEPEVVFNEPGFPPQKILGQAEGQKLKPLAGLEESIKVGKALRRSEEDVGARAIPPAVVESTGEVARAPQASFKVAGGLFEVESPEAAYRNVILFERNPLIRVAAKRAFGKGGIKIAQFGLLDEARGAMTDFFRAQSFFVSFLEYTDDDASTRLLHQIKRRNPRLPVVMLDQEADVRRRHDLTRAGADLYLTKPSGERLEPGVAEEELTLFADELVVFAERAFKQWEGMTGGGPDAGRRFYEEADKANVERSFTVLQQLINEVSNPDDIDQLSSTILRLAEEYVDRAAVFMVADGEFVGVGGFGISGSGDDIGDRVKMLRIPQMEPSILADVASSREPHRGKMRKTASNVTLIDTLGGLLPTEVVCLPILHEERAVGILYGDNAEHRAPIDSLTGLEIFLGQAGYAFNRAVGGR
jgi:CheY-like chemotaxis protein